MLDEVRWLYQGTMLPPAANHCIIKTSYFGSESAWCLLGRHNDSHQAPMNCGQKPPGQQSFILAPRSRVLATTNGPAASPMIPLLVELSEHIPDNMAMCSEVGLGSSCLK
jgi:hypothetical protein